MPFLKSLNCLLKWPSGVPAETETGLITSVQIVVGIVIVAAYVALFAVRWFIWWQPQFKSIEEPPASRGPFESFIAETPNLDDVKKRAAASEILRAETNALYAELNEAIKSQEGKATTFLGFVGGGLSIYALGIEVKAPLPHPTPLTVLAILFFLICLIACSLCIAGRRRRGLPELRTEFAKTPLLNDIGMTEARVSAYSFQLLHDRFLSYRSINIKKSYWLEVAQYTFCVGALCLVVNLLLNPIKPDPAQRLHCSSTSTRFVTVKTLDCLLTGGNNGK